MRALALVIVVGCANPSPPPMPTATATPHPTGVAVGDLSGLHVAFVALQQRPGPAIDGFTPAQQFFLAWGQLRGESIGIEAERNMVKTDIHPVPRLRVNGPLPNLPEFQAAFACKATPQPCSVW